MGHPMNTKDIFVQHINSSLTLIPIKILIRVWVEICSGIELEFESKTVPFNGNSNRNLPDFSSIRTSILVEI